MSGLTPRIAVRRHVRPLVYFGLLTVLALITAVAAGEATSFASSYTTQRRADLEDQLSQLVVDAEGRIVAERLRPVFSEMAESDDLALLEVRARHDPLVDALYVWDGDEMIFPPPAIEADLVSLRAMPCMTALPGAASADPERLAQSYAACFPTADSNVALFSTSEAVELLINAGLHSQADVLVGAIPALTAVPLSEARRRGADLSLLVGVQLQRARAINAGGRPALAQEWVVDVARQLAVLDGPDLERTLDLTDFPIPAELKEYPGPLRELTLDVEERIARAHRRLDAWKELSRYPIGSPGTPSLGEVPRVVVDPVGDPPWVAFVSRLGMGELTGAVQVDQAELARDILDHSKSRFLQHLSIRDSTSRVLAGTTEDPAVEVPFPHLLHHMRAGFSQSAVPSGGQARSAFALRLAPFAMAIGIGVAALLALMRADRQQEILLQRQRDFVARVSHELKTPLAGIRVMAESLEIGAYRGDAQRELFAHRIVQEADRLTVRVNEVIKAATRPEDDVRVATDIDALLNDLVVAWRPRLEAVGVRLFVDSAAMGTLMVMPVLVHDALNNLLDNAMKYRKSERGGQIWLRASLRGRWAIFEVEDDGMGVPSGQRKSIFERFRRVEGGGRGKAGGHGLGLAFVADTARLHDGKVECADGVAGGSRFTLRIRRRS